MLRAALPPRRRLDRFYDAAGATPEGVLSPDDVDELAAALREPELREPLLSLREKALREGRRRTSRAGDEYLALPEADPVGAAGGGGGGTGAGAGAGAGAGRGW